MSTEKRDGCMIARSRFDPSRQSLEMDPGVQFRNVFVFPHVYGSEDRSPSGLSARPFLPAATGGKRQGRRGGTTTRETKGNPLDGVIVDVACSWRVAMWLATECNRDLSRFSPILRSSGPNCG